MARLMIMGAWPVLAVDGVRIFRYPPEHWVTDDAGVTVWQIWGKAGIAGVVVAGRRSVRVPVDLAHDLSREPQASVLPGCGDERGILGWQVTVLGFIEAEAWSTFDALALAIIATRS